MPKLITTEVTMLPSSMLKYLDDLDKLNLGWSFVDETPPSSRRQFAVMELWLGGSDHNGTKIRLMGNGTWEATTHVVIGETDA